MLDQAANLRKMVNENETISNSKRARIITITSGKGGVGKTSLSVNMGIALAKAGKKVLLFDGDLGLANINVLLGVIPKYNLFHVVKGHKKLKDIIIHTPEGLDIVAGASGYSMLANLSDTERNALVNGFETLTGYDILLIDTGAGVGANVVGLTTPADEILVVTTPEPTAITDAYGIIKSIVLSTPNKNIKLLVNRANSALEGRKVAERVVNICEQFLNTEIENIGFIYNDENVSKSVRKQKPFYVVFPKSKASSCLNNVVSKILNNDDIKTSASREGTFGSFFKNFFGASSNMVL